MDQTAKRGGGYYVFCIYLLGAVKTRELHNTAYTTNMSTYGVGKTKEMDAQGEPFSFMHLW